LKGEGEAGGQEKEKKESKRGGEAAKLVAL